MTAEEAIRLLDPQTTVEEIAAIEYYAGFNGRQAVIEAITDATIIACGIMRKSLIERGKSSISGEVQEAIRTLDENIPPPGNKMVDREHLKICTAWETIKKALAEK